mmetsp:Transcript_2004/g.5909  ORF Transcript_2004/g.5909 Transcript_2004/m.5909 type:complete len:260 (-) Transcript_2004:19-798(-)
MDQAGSVDHLGDLCQPALLLCDITELHSMCRGASDEENRHGPEALPPRAEYLLSGRPQHRVPLAHDAHQVSLHLLHVGRDRLNDVANARWGRDGRVELALGGGRLRLSFAQENIRGRRSAGAAAVVGRAVRPVAESTGSPGILTGCEARETGREAAAALLPLEGDVAGLRGRVGGVELPPAPNGTCRGAWLERHGDEEEFKGLPGGCDSTLERCRHGKSGAGKSSRKKRRIGEEREGKLTLERRFDPSCAQEMRKAVLC